MSDLARRTSTKTIRRPAARRAINRISAELDSLIEWAPEKAPHVRVRTRTVVIGALNQMFADLYGEKK
jgi:hypothetical protein